MLAFQSSLFLDLHARPCMALVVLKQQLSAIAGRWPICWAPPHSDYTKIYLYFHTRSFHTTFTNLLVSHHVKFLMACQLLPSKVTWDLWWTKWCRGRFSLSNSVSPAIHSTKFSILTITQGRYNRPVSGRLAEWTQFGLHPPLCKII
jgi:hypothetical protein